MAKETKILLAITVVLFIYGVVTGSLSNGAIVADLILGALILISYIIIKTGDLKDNSPKHNAA